MASASRSKAWAGAITLAGFPVNVTVSATARGQKVPSFKTLGPSGQPIKTQNLDTGTGKVVDYSVCGRGATVGTGKNAVVVPLSDEAVEQIKSVGKSESLDPTFPLRETVPLHLSERHYWIAPDNGVPGSAPPVNILWNGLHASGRVAVAEWTKTAGSPSSLLVIEAIDGGLIGHELPFAEHLYEAPDWKPEVDEKAAQTFDAFVSAAATTEDFVHEAYTDGFLERRQRAVEAAMKGEKIEAPKAAEPKSDAPDLLAAMQAMAEQVGEKPKTTPKKKPAAKKPRAKKAPVAA
jgi:non-homologous end joining protein Ku